MRFKNFLLLSVFILAIVPLYLSINHLNEYTASQYRLQIQDKLSALSQIAKKKVLSAIKRVEDISALISSRTQLHVSLMDWYNNQQSEHIDKINQILNDAVSTQIKSI